MASISEKVQLKSDRQSLGGAGAVSLMQHCMSVDPGQCPAWKEPPEQPSLDLLLQYPESLPTLQVFSTQHWLNLVSKFSSKLQCPDAYLYASTILGAKTLVSDANTFGVFSARTLTFWSFTSISDGTIKEIVGCL
jgi:hypothetical protein